MKILVVVHGFPPAALGGTEIYAHAHARALRHDHGDDILVFTREDDPGAPEYGVRREQIDGLEVVRVNNTFSRARSFAETYTSPAIAAIASRLIDEFKPDIAHIHHLTCLSTLIVRSLAQRKVPCVLTLHDYWLLCHRGQLLDCSYRLCDGPGATGCHACLDPAAGARRFGFAVAPAIRALERRLPTRAGDYLRRVSGRAATMASSAREADGEARRRADHMRQVCAEATRLLAPSRYLRDRFVAFGIAPERIATVELGVDHAPFHEMTRFTAPHLRLGFLGTLMISKAPHLLLEAVQRLPRSSVSVDLFGAISAYHGDDSYRRRLEPLLAMNGVRAHGAVPHHRVVRALGSIDVLVVPSIWPENSPLVIREAFLAGLPVIASRIGGIPEAVEDGRNGLLFRAGDVDDLARTLRRFLDEPALLDTLRAGIPSVRSIEEDVRETRGLYESLWRHPPAGRSGPGEHRDPVAAVIAAVVLNHRTPDDTWLAVKSLLASHRPLDFIVVVDNDARDAAFGGTLTAMSPRVTYLHTGKNLGFSGGMNAGIRAALGKGAARVLLVNSDVVVPPDCVAQLERCLDAVPHAGIAGPVVLARSDPARITSLGMSYGDASGRMRHQGFGQHVDGIDLPEQDIVDGVSGCCMLIARDTFDAIGLFDDDYFFGFEDLDFCLRARRAGFLTVVAGAARVHHEGGRSIGANSPRRLYFAARNHLLLARRCGTSRHPFRSAWRSASIVALNLAHASFASGRSRAARLRAVAEGTRDYFRGRFGAGPESR